MDNKNKVNNDNPQQNLYCVYAGYSPRISKDHTFYLNDTVVGDTLTYIPLLEVLRTANIGDTVTIYINGYGGSLYTSTQIMNAIAKSPAIVTTVACANINSGHAMIWMSGDILEYEAGVKIMFHTFTGGGWGKGHDGASSLQSTLYQMKTLFKEFGTGFFSDEMLEYIFSKNTDIWFTDYEGEVHDLDGRKPAIYNIHDLHTRICTMLLNRLETGDVKDPNIYDKDSLEKIVYGETESDNKDK